MNLRIIGDVAAGLVLAGCSTRGSLSNPSALASPVLNARPFAGRLFVGNQEARNVTVYKSTGRGPVKAITSGLSIPSGVTTDNQGDLFVASHTRGHGGEVTEYSANTFQIVSEIKTFQPKWLAEDASNNLYGVFSQDITPRITRKWRRIPPIGGSPLRKSRYSDEQITAALRQAESGTPIAEIVRKLGISEATFYAWRKRFGSLGTPEIRELRQLREENSRLKRLVADLTLDRQILQDVVKKSGEKGAAHRHAATSQRALAVE